MPTNIGISYYFKKHVRTGLVQLFYLDVLNFLKHKFSNISS
jgi:hypothetical protein